jgi:hypothetical protein
MDRAQCVSKIRQTCLYTPQAILINQLFSFANPQKRCPWSPTRQQQNVQPRRRRRWLFVLVFFNAVEFRTTVCAFKCNGRRRRTYHNRPRHNQRSHRRRIKQLKARTEVRSVRPVLRSPSQQRRRADAGDRTQFRSTYCIPRYRRHSLLLLFVVVVVLIRLICGVQFQATTREPVGPWRHVHGERRLVDENGPE